MLHLEENFNEIFKKMYETEFIDYIFETYETRVGKEEFVQSITGTRNNPSRINQIFKPSSIRKMLHAHIDFAEIEADVSMNSS